MTTYLDFESTLHLLTITYMFPVIVLAVASAIGLAVIETVERASEL